MSSVGPNEGSRALPLVAGSLFRASRAAGTTTLKGKVWMMRSSLRDGPNSSISPSLPSMMTSSMSKTSGTHGQVVKTETQLWIGSDNSEILPIKCSPSMCETGMLAASPSWLPRLACRLAASWTRLATLSVYVWELHTSFTNT